MSKSRPYNKDPVFKRIYAGHSIEYRFKFWGTDEREMHKQIIHLLQKRLPKLKLHGDKKGGDE